MNGLSNLEISSEMGITSASTDLLQRSVPADVIKERTEQLQTPLTQTEQLDACSVLVFRLGREWFALAADLCAQVLSPVAAHTLPHRSNSTLLGIVNVRGQMLLKVSFLELLGLSPTHSDALDEVDRENRQNPDAATKIYPRMVVMERPRPAGDLDVWVFDVDELDGIHSIVMDALEAPAAGVQMSAATCTKRVFLWQDRRVNLLDDAQLFDALRRRAL